MKTAVIRPWLHYLYCTPSKYTKLSWHKITLVQFVMSSTFTPVETCIKVPLVPSIVCVCMQVRACVCVCVRACVHAVRCRFFSVRLIQNDAQLLTRNVRAKRRHCGRAPSCQSKEVLLNLFKLWKHFEEKKQCSSCALHDHQFSWTKFQIRQIFLQIKVERDSFVHEEQYIRYITTNWTPRIFWKLMNRGCSAGEALFIQ